MADVLFSFVEAMNALPDNTTRLISPDDVRSAFLSLTADRGSCYADDDAAPWVIPIPAVDTWVDINAAIFGDIVDDPGNLFWRTDANGRLVYDYQGDWPPTVIPTELVRDVLMFANVSIDPGNSAWQFAIAINGVPQEPAATVDLSTQADSITIPVSVSQGLKPADSLPVSVQVRNLTGADDLTLQHLSMNTLGGPYPS